jgi:hypothetical protein
MQRYFIEVRYGGAGLSGFQVQENASTVQGLLERAIEIYIRKRVVLTEFFSFRLGGENTGRLGVSFECAFTGGNCGEGDLCDAGGGTL